MPRQRRNHEPNARQTAPGRRDAETELQRPTHRPPHRDHVQLQMSAHEHQRGFLVGFMAFLMIMVYLRTPPLPFYYVTVTLSSAKDLDVGSNGRWCGIYAKITNIGEKQNTQSGTRTPAKKEGNNPVWNHDFLFLVPGKPGESNNNLTFVFLCEWTNSYVGKAVISLMDLWAGKGYSRSQSGETLATAQVTSHSGKPQGLLVFSYKVHATQPAKLRRPLVILPWVEKPQQSLLGTMLEYVELMTGSNGWKLLDKAHGIWRLVSWLIALWQTLFNAT